VQADDGGLTEARMAHGSAEGDSGGRYGAAGQIRFWSGAQDNGPRVVRVASEESSSARSSPLYLWVASLLRDTIEAGELGPNASVPSERALSEQYGISRMTARHALETLMLEGYVCRDARRGTFVAEPRLRFSVGSFTRIMAEGDHVPGCEVLIANTLDPDPFISEMLDLPADGRIHLVQRLRTAKGEPIAIENIYVSAQRFPDLLEFDLTGSLWEILRSRYGVHPTKADARVVAVTLDRFAAETLRVKAGSPAIALTRTVYGAEGEVVELARDVYRGDRAEFYVTAPVDSVPPATRRSRS
jgi:GntR family transcriptional regulator